MNWLWPLSRSHGALPKIGEPGAFGAIRKHDRHCGIDLYSDPGEEVLAVECGTVVAVEPFTGVEAESPWWNDTACALVEGASGVVVYGEIRPQVTVGRFVERGTVIGSVLTVLRQDKGRPMSMLHLELHTHGTRTTFWWRDERPVSLRDPTALLTTAWG